jgi:ubiquinone/menaquinone biosynthesis C-methylase UbiE
MPVTSPDGGYVTVDRPIGQVAEPGPHQSSEQNEATAIPAYLREVYGWAYLNPTNARLLDCDAVVSTILLGNNRRLRRSLLREIEPGQRVLHVAHVYGRLIPELAGRVGRSGQLDVIDLVPLQVALCRRKLRGFHQAQVRIADAAQPGDGMYDAVSCFFLLHEIPDGRKRAVVDALLPRVVPGGRVVFVDYHKPARWHPLRGVMRGLMSRLEPFAESLWHHEIAEFASAPGDYRWEKQTLFGGLYQKTVAYRP